MLSKAYWTLQLNKWNLAGKNWRIAERKKTQLKSNEGNWKTIFKLCEPKNKENNCTTQPNLNCFHLYTVFAQWNAFVLYIIMLLLSLTHLQRVQCTHGSGVHREYYRDFVNLLKLFLILLCEMVGTASNLPTFHFLLLLRNIRNILDEPVHFILFVRVGRPTFFAKPNVYLFYFSKAVCLGVYISRLTSLRLIFDVLSFLGGCPLSSCPLIWKIMLVLSSVVLFFCNYTIRVCCIFQLLMFGTWFYFDRFLFSQFFRSRNYCFLP